MKIFTLLRIAIVLIMSTDILTAEILHTPDTQYEIVAHIGNGSSGAVFLARDECDRQVAIKRLQCREKYKNSIPEEYLNHLFTSDGTSVAAMQEFAFSQLLCHECIMKIERLFTETGNDGYTYTYLVMEYIDGKMLDEIEPRSQSRKQGIENILHFFSALKHAYHQNLIHLDLYSDNVMYDHDGKIKLIDIGSFDQVVDGEELYDKNKRHIRDVIHTVISILSRADFDDAELNQLRTYFFEISKKKPYKSILKSKITTDSIDYFISFLDEIANTVRLKPK
jgi:serine/threonine protein kinase